MSDGKFIWPCGAIANSKFQDEISLFSMSSGVIQQIKLKRTGIAWASDIAYKFKNPPGWNTPEFRKSHVKPKGNTNHSCVGISLLTFYCVFSMEEKSLGTGSRS